MVTYCDLTTLHQVWFSAPYTHTHTHTHTHRTSFSQTINSISPSAWTAAHTCLAQTHTKFQQHNTLPSTAPVTVLKNEQTAVPNPIFNDAKVSGHCAASQTGSTRQPNASFPLRFPNRVVLGHRPVILIGVFVTAVNSGI